MTGAQAAVATCCVVSATKIGNRSRGRLLPVMPGHGWASTTFFRRPHGWLIFDFGQTPGPQSFQLPPGHGRAAQHSKNDVLALGMVAQSIPAG